MNQICTIYQNIYSKDAHYITIEKALQRIKSGASEQRVKEIRDSLDKEKANYLKRSLPSICFSGKFHPNREDSCLQEHSGYIVLDFDNLDDPKSKVENLSISPFISAAWISPGGNGVKALVKIADGSKHRLHFNALKELFPEIDESGVNPSRVCYESYDPNIYLNEKADTFTRTLETTKVTEVNAVGDERVIFSNILKWLTNKGGAFVKGERNIYIFKLASACCRFGVHEQAAISLISNEYPPRNDFSNSELVSVIKSAYKRNIFSSAVFEHEVLIDKTTRKEVSFPKIEEIDPDAPAKDVIFGQHVKPNAFKIYEHGYESVRGVGVPELDNIYKAKKGEVTCLTGFGNAGKALHIETLIPTVDGWKKMGDVQIGDKVFDENGHPCNVTNVTEVMYGRKCYKMTLNDGTEIIADEDHQWVTDTYSRKRTARRKYKKDVENNDNKTSKDYLDDMQVVTTKQISNSLYGFSNKRFKNHSIRLAKPIHLPYRELPIQPYILGAWLGDGHKDNGRITCDDPFILEEIHRQGHIVKQNKTKYQYNIVGLKEKLRKEKLIKRKVIPQEYLRASINQRLELLQGLMDTDGTISDNGSCEFSNKNGMLAYQVFELATSLGIRATIRENDSFYYDKYMGIRYRVLFVTNLPVFKLPRKLAKIKNTIRFDNRMIVSCEPTESVPVKCIEVDSPNHLYLCTKSYVVTHNSSFFRWYILMRILCFGEKFASFSPEDNPPEEYYHDFVEILLGRNCADKYPDGTINTDKPDKHVYENAYDFISQHIFYLYPKDIAPSPSYIKERFLELIIKEKVDGVCIDPFNQMAHDYNNDRSDHYLEKILGEFSRFAQNNGVYFFIIAHPTKMQKEGNGNYACPDVFDITGGSMWNNKMDNILVYHRPIMQTTPDSPICELHSKKIKRQKIVGLRGKIDMDYTRRTRRYEIGNKDVMQEILINNGLDFNNPVFEYKPNNQSPQVYSKPSAGIKAHYPVSSQDAKENNEQAPF